MDEISVNLKEVLEEAANDITLLDAFLAWTQNPTTMSAGYALNSQYGCIKSIIEKRHPYENASDVVNSLSRTIEEIVGASGKDIDNLGGDPLIDQLEESLRALIEEKYMDELVKWHISELKNQEQHTRELLCSLKLYLYKDGNLTTKIKTNLLAAIHKAVFDYIIPESIDLDCIGFTNTLYYRSVSGATTEYVQHLTPYTQHLVENLALYREELSLSDPPQVDVKKVANSITDRVPNEEALVSTVFEKPHLPDYLHVLYNRKKRHNIPYVLASYNDSWAINPLIKEELREELGRRRKGNLETYARRLNDCFSNLEKNRPRKRYFHRIVFNEKKQVYMGKFESRDIGTHETIVVCSAVTPFLDSLNMEGGALFILPRHHPIAIERWVEPESTAVVRYQDAYTLVGKETEAASRITKYLSSSPIVGDKMDDIVTAPGEEFKGYMKVREIIAAAKDYVHVIETWCGEDTLIALDKAKKGIEIRLLTQQMNDKKKQKEFEILAGKFMHQRPNFKVRLDPEYRLHDRFIITETGVWSHGHSIKDIGRKLSLITRLKPEREKEIRQHFAELWSESNEI